MRLVTGATARSNIQNLYTETSWQNLHDRYKKATLIMMYKIKNNIAPDYLIQYVPPENNAITEYNLRNKFDLSIPKAMKDPLKKSFFSVAVQFWNELALHIRHFPDIDDFKVAISADRREKNILYFYGQRWPSVHHSRMRIGCSKLNSDLYFHLHVIDNPSCSCGNENEDPYHYFINCPHYIDIRCDLFSAISAFTDVNINTILFGNSMLTTEQNEVVFDAVHLFIIRSERFD
jgi:hypothetical protein